MNWLLKKHPITNKTSHKFLKFYEKIIFEMRVPRLEGQSMDKFTVYNKPDFSVTIS